MVNKSFWKGKRIFLTGHTGFKGSWLTRWLHILGAEVCGYALAPNTNPSLFHSAKVSKYVQSIFGDIRDLEKLRTSMLEFQPDIVIHMAAQPLVGESYEQPVETFSINTMGTVNVLESIRSCPSVKVMINVTTDKVYENKEWVWGYRETDRLGGYDPYSSSKACSELITLSYMNSFFHPDKYSVHGVAIATVRAGNVIGGGDWTKNRLIPDVISAIENKQNIIIRNPYSIRPWQHVLEALSGYLKLIEKLYINGVQFNGAWNFGPSKENYARVLEIVEQMNVEAKREIQIITSDLYETVELRLDSTKSNQLLTWQTILTFDETIQFIKEWIQIDIEKESDSLCEKQIQMYMKERS